jgi:hypothetical protein
MTTAQERLNIAHLAIYEERYEEALSELVWFHENALKEEPGLYGVRLSFALAYWMELAEVFPKAREILEEIRNKKTIELIEGKGDYDLFHDVISINEVLNHQMQTHALFLKLKVSNPTLAESCAKLALPAIVKTKDYKTAIEYLPEPKVSIEKLSNNLNEHINELNKFPRQHRSAIRNAHVKNYAENVQLIVAVLNGLGQPSEAKNVTSMAYKLVSSATARKAIKSALAAGI